MQEKDVEIVRAQPFETAFDGGKNMLFGKVVDALANPAFGLQNDLFAGNSQFFRRFFEADLALSAAVNVRMIEHIHARIQRRFQKFLHAG